MHKVSRSAIVPYTASEMYALVADFESYPEFLPWCSRATLHSRESEIVEASLEFQRGKLRKAFRTRNRLLQDEAIEIGLLGGTFRHMSGGWSFRPLGETGSKVLLDMEFEFESRMTDMVFGRLFEDMYNKLVDAFIVRAIAVYGPR